MKKTSLPHTELQIKHLMGEKQQLCNHGILNACMGTTNILQVTKKSTTVRLYVKPDNLL